MYLWYARFSETSFMESGNKALEYCGYEPKPSDGIHQSTEKNVAHTDIAHQKRQIEALQFMKKGTVSKTNHPKGKLKINPSTIQVILTQKHQSALLSS